MNFREKRLHVARVRSEGMCAGKPEGNATQRRRNRWRTSKASAGGGATVDRRPAQRVRVYPQGQAI